MTTLLPAIISLGTIPIRRHHQRYALPPYRRSSMALTHSMGRRPHRRSDFYAQQTGATFSTIKGIAGALGCVEGRACIDHVEEATASARRDLSPPSPTLAGRRHPRLAAMSPMWRAASIPRLWRELASAVVGCGNATTCCSKPATASAWMAGKEPLKS